VTLSDTSVFAYNSSTVDMSTLNRLVMWSNGVCALDAKTNIEFGAEVNADNNDIANTNNIWE
jgi:hypothetical protein